MTTAIDSSTSPLDSLVSSIQAADTTNNNTSDNTQKTTESTDDFSTFMTKVLNRQAEQNVSEEELFSGLIGQRLTKLGKTEAAELYQTELSKAKTTYTKSDGFIENEAAANEALRQVVEAGALTKEEAEKIKGEAFAAAQLDDNKDALYDDRGSENDPTIAVSKLEAALFAMKTLVEKIDNGEIECESRPLEESSTGSSGGVDADNSDADGASSGGLSGSVPLDGAGGFLWKPISESSGKLVVLLPASLSTVVERLEVHSDLPPTEATKLGEGDYDKQFGDGRSIYRFSKSGPEFGDNVHVVAFKEDGSTVTWDIEDGSARND